MTKLSLKIPPVAQGVIALILVFLVNRYLPVYRMDIRFKGPFSLTIVGIGVLVGITAVAAFIRLRTTVDPRYPNKASRLVVIGIYKYSRNPMYLAILLILTGVAVCLGALSSLSVIFLFVAFIHFYQILPEEKALEQKFGESYRQYAGRVRRWI